MERADEEQSPLSDSSLSATPTSSSRPPLALSSCVRTDRAIGMKRKRTRTEEEDRGKRTRRRQLLHSSPGWSPPRETEDLGLIHGERRKTRRKKNHEEEKEEEEAVLQNDTVETRRTFFPLVENKVLFLEPSLSLIVLFLSSAKNLLRGKRTEREKPCSLSPRHNGFIRQKEKYLFKKTRNLPLGRGGPAAIRSDCPGCLHLKKLTSETQMKKRLRTRGSEAQQ